MREWQRLGGEILDAACYAPTDYGSRHTFDWLFLNFVLTLFPIIKNEIYFIVYS
jgi:hypothetical protein